MNLELLRAVGRWITVLSVVSAIGIVITVALLPRITVPDVDMPASPVNGSDDTAILDAYLQATTSSRRHFMIQFRRELTRAEIAAFKSESGLNLYGPVPERAYFASVRPADWPDVRDTLESRSPRAAKIFLLRPDDKLAPKLRNTDSANLPTAAAFAMFDDYVQVFVDFFPDVPFDEQVDILTGAFATQVLDESNLGIPDVSLGPDPAGIWAVLVPPEQVWILAQIDAVRFIELTTPEITNDMDIARMDSRVQLTDATGEGTVIAQFEGCSPASLHPDLVQKIVPFGLRSMWCGAWFFEDKDSSGFFEVGEPVWYDADEDGSVDRVVVAGNNAGDAASGKWRALRVVDYDNNDNELFVEAENLEDNIVSENDIILELVFWPPRYSPKLVKSSHPGLGEELVERTFAGHATMVAGIMVGATSTNVEAGGILPEARLRTYPWNHLSMTVGYPIAMLAGAQVSNHSFGWADDHYHLGTHEYGTVSAFYDLLASGRKRDGLQSSLPGRILVTGSTGNASSEIHRWRTSRIANSAKNTLSVGNVSSSDAVDEKGSFGLPAPSSGRGPTTSGRLAPVLSAPGSQLNCDISAGDVTCDPKEDTGINSTFPADRYASGSGTSFSTPIVAAGTAAVARGYKVACEANPWPQDLRAIVAHSAEDLTRADNLDFLLVEEELVGPDFVFGFGTIRIDGALDLIRNSVRGKLDGGWDEHHVFISSEDQLVKSGDDWLLRVTLAWDDPPYYAGYAPREGTGYLQNDLDLELIGPGGKRYLPWVLDASEGNEAGPATRQSRRPFQYVPRKSRDHRNTIEQVVADVSPAEFGSTWIVRIRSSKLYLGNQEYSLVSEAFRQFPGQDCGTFSNGFTRHIAAPVDLPDTWLGWLLYWFAVIILLWLIFEAMLLLYDVVYKAGHPYLAILSVIFALGLLLLVLRLVRLPDFLALAGVVLIIMCYVAWRATRAN